MTFNRDEAFSGWCCVDCLVLLANGETDPDWTEAETAEYLARVAHFTKGTEVSLGAFREDHECATNYTVTWHAPAGTRGTFLRGTVEVRADNGRDAADAAWFHHDTPARMWVVRVQAHELETESDRGGECECEQLTFSWSQCDVCGSNLGGARDAVVFWLQPDAAPPALASTAPSVPSADPEARIVNDAANALAAKLDGRAVPDNWDAISSGFGYRAHD